MTTGIEKSVELRGAAQELLDGAGVGVDVLVVVEEVLGNLVVLEELDGARVDGSDAALGGSDDYLSLGGKNLVGVGELGLETDTLAYCTAQLTTSKRHVLFFGEPGKMDASEGSLPGTNQWGSRCWASCRRW